jgi:AhpD family alkylhydroperoxidase
MSTGQSYRERLRNNGKHGQKLEKHMPELFDAHWKRHKAAVKPGALDQKTKELIGLALVVAMHCDVCIAFHVRDCLRAGATEEEIMETLGVVVMEGDGPALVYAGNAMEAWEEYQAAHDKQRAAQ